MLKNAEGKKMGKVIRKSVRPISVTARAIEFITGIAGEKTFLW